MKIKVLLFAAMREAAGGGPARETDLPEGARVADAWQAVASGCEPLHRFERSMLCAVNASYAGMDRPLSEGDAVAFFPPVSGG